LARLVAYIIDSVLVGVFSMILFFFLSLPILLRGFFDWLNYWNALFRLPSFLGLIYVLYFTLMEGVYGYTFGKRIMDLEVVTEDGRPTSLARTFVRNLSKIFWAFLLLDLILGFASKGDPRQRFTDRVAGTTVAERRSRRGWGIFASGFSFESPTIGVSRLTRDLSHMGRASLELANFGAFLIAAAVVFLLNPGLSSEILRYLESWGKIGHPVIPPLPFLVPAFHLLVMMGTWRLILAGIMAAKGYGRRSVSDATWGGFLLVTGYLAYQRLLGALTTSALLALVVIAFGAMIIIRTLAR